VVATIDADGWSRIDDTVLATVFDSLLEADRARREVRP
jgi:hypothetical protein